MAEDLLGVLNVIQAGLNKNTISRAGQRPAGEKRPVSLVSDPVQLG